MRAAGLVDGSGSPLEPRPGARLEPPRDAPPRAQARPVGRLKERREFLAAAKARSAATPGFVLQARRRNPRDAERLAEKLGPETAQTPRVGFTASKKVGNAVTRNRAKRRMRALACEIAPLCARDGWDYVMIARVGETVARPFAQMREELIEAFRRAHDAPANGGRGGRKGGPRRAGAGRTEKKSS